MFGVQKIVNLACGSFYALGAYFGITAVGMAITAGMPPCAVPAGPGRRRACLGASARRSSALLRTIYDRDESSSCCSPSRSC